MKYHRSLYDILAVHYIFFAMVYIYDIRNKLLVHLKISIYIDLSKSENHSCVCQTLSFVDFLYMFCFKNLCLYVFLLYVWKTYSNVQICEILITALSCKILSRQQSYLIYMVIVNAIVSPSAPSFELQWRYFTCVVRDLAIFGVQRSRSNMCFALYCQRDIFPIGNSGVTLWYELTILSLCQ